jgi:hypothetical protein
MAPRSQARLLQQTNPEFFFDFGNRALMVRA